MENKDSKIDLDKIGDRVVEKVIKEFLELSK
jgi:hypothetical protein